MYSKGGVIFVICVFTFVFCCFSIPLIILYATDEVTSDFNPAKLAAIRVDNCALQQVIKKHNWLIMHAWHG